MDTTWGMVLGAGLGLVAGWLCLVAPLVLGGRRFARPGLREVLRLLPDLLRLLRAPAADRHLPRGIRVRLWLLLAYLAMPLDLIPDVFPVIGWADDAIVVALVLRSVARSAGAEVLQRHWPGDPAGLAVVLRATGIRPGTAGSVCDQT